MKKLKCEIYRDSMQNYKKYAIPPAQLIIADVPYNVGKNFYGSNPMWYNGGDNKNGESKLAGKAAFNSDFNFNLYEYFHFCSKMLKKEDKNSVTRGRSSNSPCMIVFCSFEQMPTLIDAAYKHGFVHYIPLVFVKNYSPQVLKANMRVVGATEYALVFYRDKLPKFRNGAKVDEDGKTIRGTGKMIFNWFSWEKDGKDIPKIHPAQKPVALYEWLLNRYAKPGDIILDTHVGSASSLIACYRTNHPYVGFELDKYYYDLSKKRLDAEMAQMRLSDFMPEVMP
jgi:site-specific DNA-methyltransferase (adenine-specific)